MLRGQDLFSLHRSSRVQGSARAGSRSPSPRHDVSGYWETAWAGAAAEEELSDASLPGVGRETTVRFATAAIFEDPDEQASDDDPRSLTQRNPQHVLTDKNDTTPTKTAPDSVAVVSGSTPNTDACAPGEGQQAGGPSGAFQRVFGDNLHHRRRNVDAGGGYAPVDAVNMPWYIIGPDTMRHWAHECLGDMLTLYAAVAIPLFISFRHIRAMEVQDWYAINAAVDALFMLDFVSHFLVAYWDRHGNLVFSRRSIFMRYASGYMAFDLVAALPMTMAVGRSVYTVSNKLVRLARLPRTMKAVKIIKKLSATVEGHDHQNFFLALYGMAQVLLYLFIVLHWVACGWHLVADWEDSPASWIQHQELQGSMASELYVASLYWTITTLSTVGYGDITADTTGERLYCVVVMLAGATLYALAIGSISHIVANIVARRKVAARVRLNTAALIRRYGIEPELAEEIRRNVDLTGETEAVSEQDALETLTLLPPRVRTKALLRMHADPISRIRFLRERREMQPIFVTSLVAALRGHLYPKVDEVLLKEGLLLTEVVFLVEGSLAVSRGGQQVGTLRAGSMYGELGPRLPCPQTASLTITAASRCEAYTVPVAKLHQLERQFPLAVGDLKEELSRTLAALMSPKSQAAAPPQQQKHTPSSQTPAACCCSCGGKRDSPPGSHEPSPVCSGEEWLATWQSLQRLCGEVERWTSAQQSMSDRLASLEKARGGARTTLPATDDDD